MAPDAKGLKLPGLGQVGIVVRDIDRAIDYYRDTFGLRRWAVFEGEPEKCVERGEEIFYSGRMAMAQAGPVQVELIQILEGESIHTEFLRDHGEGVHHLGFFVSNLDRRLEAAREAGITVLQRGTLKQMGLTIDYAYLDTVGIGGVIIEYVQSRFLGFRFPMRSPLLRLGAWMARKINR